jgi:hypothetical protein
MRTVEFVERPSEPFEVAIAPDESEYTLNIVGVYQDVASRSWAMQTCQRATLLAGEKRVQDLWFNAHSLSDTGILLEAIRAVLVADVIVISVYAENELPIGLYVWVQAWLPRRLSRRGVLAALVAVPEPPDSTSVRTMKYLRAVAHKGKLDFISQEGKRLASSIASSMKLIAEHGGTDVPALQELQASVNPQRITTTLSSS